MPDRLPLVANVSVLGCALRTEIRRSVVTVSIPVNFARPAGSIIGDNNKLSVIVPGVENGVKLPKPMARPAELTCPITPSDGVPELLVQLADPVMDAVMEVSVPFAGLNCATDVPANSLLLVNDNVAAGLIVIVKFSVMVSALAAGARTAAPTAAAINPDLTVRM